MVASDNAVSEANVGQRSDTCQGDHGNVVSDTSSSCVAYSIAFDHCTHYASGSVLSEEHFFNSSVGTNVEAFNTSVGSYTSSQGVAFANIDSITFVEAGHLEVIYVSGVSEVEQVCFSVVTSHSQQTGFSSKIYRVGQIVNRIMSISSNSFHCVVCGSLCFGFSNQSVSGQLDSSSVYFSSIDVSNTNFGFCSINFSLSSIFGSLSYVVSFDVSVSLSAGFPESG